MIIIELIVRAVCIGVLVAVVLGAWALWVTRSHAGGSHQPPAPRPDAVSRLDRLDGIEAPVIPVPRTTEEAAAWWDAQIARGEH